MTIKKLFSTKTAAKSLLIGIAALFVILFNSDIRMAHADDGESAIETYFPINSGSVKTFSGNGQTIIYSYDEVSFQGRTVFCETQSLNGGKAYYGYSSNTILLYGFSIKDTDGTVWDVSCTTPLLVMSNSLLNTLGHTQSSTLAAINGNTVNIDLTSTIYGVGEVTVPAGTYYKCIGVLMIFKIDRFDGAEPEELAESWIMAPDIGKIRVAAMAQNQDPTAWLELSSATGFDDGETPAESTNHSTNDDDDDDNSCFIRSLF